MNMYQVHLLPRRPFAVMRRERVQTRFNIGPASSPEVANAGLISCQRHFISDSSNLHEQPCPTTNASIDVRILQSKGRYIVLN